MCLEIYSPEHAIQIPFTEEIVRFTSPFGYSADHTSLVRNNGFLPITELYLLYPRHLMRADRQSGMLTPTLSTVWPLGTGFPDHIRSFPGARGEVTLTLPDPNNPVCDLPTMTGYWNPSNFADVYLPIELAPHMSTCLGLFSVYHFTPWIVPLTVPIEPGQSHWFRWRIEVPDAGTLLPRSVLGPMVFHEIGSPINVRRTVVESVELAIRKEVLLSQADPNQSDPRVRAALVAILDGLRLKWERQVDIQYYELTIHTGNPDRQVLMNCIRQGDLRMRAASPRVVYGSAEAVNLSEKIEQIEPVFEWKSGSILEPAHPWRNAGFSLRFTLVCDKESIESERGLGLN